MAETSQSVIHPKQAAIALNSETERQLLWHSSAFFVSRRDFYGVPHRRRTSVKGAIPIISGIAGSNRDTSLVVNIVVMPATGGLRERRTSRARSRWRTTRCASALSGVALSRYR